MPGVVRDIDCRSA